MVECFLLSTKEFKLLETIRAIAFGELFGVEIPVEENWIEEELHPAERDLVEFIRAGGQYIDVLTVHHSLPVIAETDMKLNGFKCRKKVKFPTV